MKISNQQYATALFEATHGKSQSEINSAVANFVKILEKNNQVKNFNGIINKFSEIWNKEEGIVEAEVVSAEKLSGELVDKLSRFIKEKYKTKEVSIVNKIDKSIKGGIIIKVGDEVMDSSVAGQLKKLKSSLEK